MRIDQLITGTAVQVQAVTSAQDAQTVLGRDTGRQPTEKRGDAFQSQPLTLVEAQAKPEEKEDVISRQVELIEELRDTIQTNSRSVLKIDRTEESGQFVYRILNPNTGDLVRQWPAEDYVNLIEYLQSKQGGLVDERV
ncbi:flagellar protein FlaG [Woodsholea maritima]|uniref:flagellar protein FlaG n=1 Tax=Woodsholea maritima TaxID=240237 RepID=UPI000372FA80|nr:flagellar protein FlaG [Woodsholea maritima]